MPAGKALPPPANAGDAFVPVSVLIPSYNYALFLPQAIDSVLAQTVRPLEVVVADDGSTDNTAEVAARYGAAVRYCRFEHRGVYALRQAMLGELKGEWFLNLDADNWIEPDFLEKAWAVVERNRGNGRLAFVYPDRMDFGDYERANPSPEFDVVRFKRGNFVDMNSLIRMEAARRHGFDPAFNDGWGDYDFFLTLAKNGWVGERMKESRLHYRVHRGSITGATAEADRKQGLMRRMAAKHADFFSPEEARRAIQRFSPEAVLRYRVCEQVWAGHYLRAAGMVLRLLVTHPRAITSMFH